MKTQAIRLLQVVALIVAALFVYAQGLKGDYEFDDAVNILENEAIQVTDLSADSLWQAGFSGNSGVLKRALSNVSFALNYYLTAGDPFYFKATNLAIHIATALAILLLSQLLIAALYVERTDRPSASTCWGISFAIAAAWLLHPIQLTSVLYVVQRMTSLASFFMVIAAILYTWGRLRLIAHRSHGILAILLCFALAWPAAILSKETGVLTPAYLFLIEALILRFRGTQNVRKGIATIFGVTLFLPLLAAVIAFAMHPSWLMGTYAYRDFGPYERLLTEARILWFYVRLLVLPNLTAMGLYHDDIPLSTSLFQPTTTALAIAGWLCVLGSAFWAIRRAPVLAFGLLWFLVGQSAESTIIGLELAHEHRNYLPSFGPLFALVYYALNPSFHPRLLVVRKFAVFAFVGLLAFSTYLRSAQWGVLFDHAVTEVQNHPLSVRTNFQMGRMYLKLYDVEHDDKYAAKAKEFFRRSTQLNEYTKTGYFGLIHAAYRTGGRADEATLSALQYRLQTKVIEFGDIVMLHNLAQCQMHEYCRLDDDEMMRLIQAPFDNRRSTPVVRAELATIAGIYAVQKMGGTEKSEHFFLQAISEDPGNPARYLTIASLYEQQGRRSEAEMYVHKAQDLDRIGTYRLEIRRRLAGLKRAAK